MSFRDELEAAYLEGDCKRVLGMLAANSRYKGNVWKFLHDFAEVAEYDPEYEPQGMNVNGYPCIVKNTLTMAIAEYMDGTEGMVLRGDTGTLETFLQEWSGTNGEGA
jgi:hypothetical protein